MNITANGTFISLQVPCSNNVGTVHVSSVLLMVYIFHPSTTFCFLFSFIFRLYTRNTSHQVLYVLCMHLIAITLSAEK